MVNLNLLLIFGFGVTALVAMFWIALSARQTPLLITLVRITVALACAGIAAFIPGFIDLNFSPTTNIAIAAGGAMAVFVLVYFFNPPGLIQHVTDDITVPLPSEDFRPVAEKWLSLVDSGQYETARQSLDEVIRSRYGSENLFREVFENTLEVIGRPQERKQVGVNSLETLPSGERGRFIGLTYRTKFTKGETHKEHLVLQAKDGHWVVHSHFVDPDAL